MEKRITVGFGQVQRTGEEIVLKTLSRLREKGPTAWADDFQALGILEIDVLGLKEAILQREQGYIREEWVDVAVNALFAIASIDARRADR